MVDYMLYLYIQSSYWQKNIPQCHQESWRPRDTYHTLTSQTMVECTVRDCFTSTFIVKIGTNLIHTHICKCLEDSWTKSSHDCVIGRPSTLIINFILGFCPWSIKTETRYGTFLKNRFCAGNICIDKTLKIIANQIKVCNLESWILLRWNAINITEQCMINAKLKL